MGDAAVLERRREEPARENDRDNWGRPSEAWRRRSILDGPAGDPAVSVAERDRGGDSTITAGGCKAGVDCVVDRSGGRAE